MLIYLSEIIMINYLTITVQPMSIIPVWYNIKPAGFKICKAQNSLFV